MKTNAWIDGGVMIGTNYASNIQWVTTGVMTNKYIYQIPPKPKIYYATEEFVDVAISITLLACLATLCVGFFLGYIIGSTPIKTK